MYPTIGTQLAVRWFGVPFTPKAKQIARDVDLVVRHAVIDTLLGIFVGAGIVLVLLSASAAHAYTRVSPYRPDGCDMSLAWTNATNDLAYCELCGTVHTCSQSERDIKQDVLVDRTEQVVQLLDDLCPSAAKRGVGPTAQNARRTHCLKGHPLVPSRPNWKRRFRNCEICQAERHRKRWGKKVAP